MRHEQERPPRGFFLLLPDPVRVIVYAFLTFAPIMVAPYVTQRLDSAGLPGGLFAVMLILLGPALAIISIQRELPSRRRLRAMKRAAAELGLHFSAWLRKPSTMSSLPSLDALERLPGQSRWAMHGFADLIAGDSQGAHVLVFDYWTKSDGALAQTRWHTMGATQIEADGSTLLVRPRTISSVAHTPELTEVRTELDSFNHRYHVLTRDPMFASAFLDTRMIEFLLGLPADWTFEVSGRWLAISAQRLPTARVRELVEALLGFRQHVPRVTSFMYPDPGPDFA
jgi:hypothetical protein